MRWRLVCWCLPIVLLFVLVVASTGAAADRVYVGTTVCRQCHLQSHELWSQSRHAQAYLSLSQPVSTEIARLSGLDQDPLASPICLGCHTTAWDTESWQRDQTFHFADGIQCERCHGPGGEYIEVMADPQAAMAAGLVKPDRRLCMICHQPKGSHQTVIEVREYQIDAALAEIAHSFPANPAREVPAQAPSSWHDPRHVEFEPEASPAPATVTYKTPFNLTVSRDSSRLYVVCEAADSLIVVDTASHQLLAEIEVGNLPHGVCLSPDEERIYVSNRGSDTVSVIDARSLTVIDTIAVGDEPHGLVTNLAGDTLYVANAGSNDVSVVALSRGQAQGSGREVKRLAAARGTWDVARSPDGGSVYVTNNLSHFVPFRTPCVSEVTVIETERSFVDNRIMIPEVNLVQGIDLAPDGELGLVTLIRTKNLVPMTRVLQGWVITNGIGVLWPDGRVDQLLLDEPDSYFADPTDVVITPDSRYAYVSGGGIDAVAVIDLARMKQVLANASEQERAELLPNHLGVPTEYVITRIAVGRNPRGLAVSPNGRSIYVADALDDTISVIDVASQKRAAVIDLGGPDEITLTRTGERIFHSAAVTYGRQFSCHSCHPDGGVDGITYDIEPDGIGLNPVDNRTLRGILDTAPFKWTGKNPSLSRQCGPRLAVFFTRIDPFTPEQVTALERYICTIPRNPNRYRALGEALTPAQRRGREAFERTHTNSGQEIPVEQRCSSCHPGPYYTSRDKVFVGQGSSLDTHNIFDIPHLNNIYETAPYLHDGRAETLEEIWTRYNPKDEHGVTNDMTKDQLNDLIEYLKTL